MQTAKLAALLLVLVALVLNPASVRAETVNCTPITSVPFVITTEGIYCLTVSIGTNLASGSAIEIQTHNVVLDLNGFKLGNLAAGRGTNAFGVRATNRQNITIKNGTIRGFFNAILLQDSNGASQGHVVEDIRADQNTVTAFDLTGSGIIVRNNQVVSTGGSTCCGPNVNAVGINVSGTGVRILNNDVIDTVPQGTGISYGIYLHGGGTGDLVVNNRITNATNGIEFSSIVVTTGKYRDNLTFDVTTPFTGGTNAGNNN